MDTYRDRPRGLAGTRTRAAHVIRKATPSLVAAAILAAGGVLSAAPASAATSTVDPATVKAGNVRVIRDSPLISEQAGTWTQTKSTTSKVNVKVTFKAAKAKVAPRLTLKVNPTGPNNTTTKTVKMRWTGRTWQYTGTMFARGVSPIHATVRHAGATHREVFAATNGTSSKLTVTKAVLNESSLKQRTYQVSGTVKAGFGRTVELWSQTGTKAPVRLATKKVAATKSARFDFGTRAIKTNETFKFWVLAPKTAHAPKAITYKWTSKARPDTTATMPGYSAANKAGTVITKTATVTPAWGRKAYLQHYVDGAWVNAKTLTLANSKKATVKVSVTTPADGTTARARLHVPAAGAFAAATTANHLATSTSTPERLPIEPKTDQLFLDDVYGTWTRSGECELGLRICMVKTPSGGWKDTPLSAEAEADPWTFDSRNHYPIYLVGMLDEVNAARQKLAPGATPFKPMPIPAARQTKLNGVPVPGQGGAAQTWIEHLMDIDAYAIGVVHGGWGDEGGVRRALNDINNPDSINYTPTPTPGHKWQFSDGGYEGWSTGDARKGIFLAGIIESPDHVGQLTQGDRFGRQIYVQFGASMNAQGWGTWVIQTFVEVPA